MWSTVHPLLTPVLSLMLLILGNGLFNTFVSLRLELEGYSPETIGMVTAALYAGILAGSLCLDRWIARVGHRTAFLQAATLSTLFVLAQSVFVNATFWAVLRFFGGVCMAGVFITIESWFLLQSSPKTRSAMLSVYVGVFYIALSLGQLLIHAAPVMSYWPFWLAAGLSIAAVVPLLSANLPQPKLEPTPRLSLSTLLRLSPIGFMGGIVSGMVLASIYGLVPVYAKEMGLSAGTTGNLMATIIFGGLSLQWPLGRLADKGSRRSVLLGVGVLSFVFSLALGYLSPHSWLFFFFAWSFGGFAFTIYPLSMTYACESVEEKQIIPATASFVLAYGIGAIAGPLLAPFAMETWGAAALFGFLGALFFLFSLSTMRWNKKIEAPEKDLEP